jgi:hypothetical protein
MPPLLRILLGLPGLRVLPARLIGHGVWRVHVQGGRRPCQDRALPDEVG